MERGEKLQYLFRRGGGTNDGGAEQSGGATAAQCQLLMEAPAWLYTPNVPLEESSDRYLQSVCLGGPSCKYHTHTAVYYARQPTMVATRIKGRIPKALLDPGRCSFHARVRARPSDCNVTNLKLKLSLDTKIPRLRPDIISHVAALLCLSL